MEKFYVTTAIDYVNAPPHIGHVLEKVQADAIARYQRLLGKEVWFLTGTDEHGMKLFRAAEEAGVPVQDFCNEMNTKFIELTKSLTLSNNDFIRTTEERHIKAAQKLWLACKKDIYSSSYKGLYCVGCEAYWIERDLEGGCCPIHGVRPETIEEKNYFFRLSAYRDALLSYYDSCPEFIKPVGRFNEIYSFVEAGLEDISISRSKEKLIWGIEVPDDPSQVMYVWFDALSNYISAIGYEDDEKTFARFWPADVHVIGKDISRFHAVMWPAMLMSAGLLLPKMIFVHGFLTVEGEKMSKSKGNVIDPNDIVEKFGVDPLRYYLLCEISTTEDGDFSQRRFEERYNFDLANDLGNLLHRNLNLFMRYLDGRVIRKTDFNMVDKAIIEEIVRGVDLYKKKMDAYELKEGVEAVMSLVRRMNKYVDETSPWSLAKIDIGRFTTVMYLISESLRVISILLVPFMPETAEKIWQHLGLEKTAAEAELGYAKEIGIGKDRKVILGEPIFPRIQR